MQHIALGCVTINKFATRSRIEAFGNPPPGVLTFGIPMENCEPFAWRHLPSPGNTIQIYQPHTELELVTRPVFQATDVSVTRDRMEKFCSLLELPDIDKIIGGREMAACRRQDIGAIRSRLAYVCQVLSLHPEKLENDIALQNIVTYEIPALIVSALTSLPDREIRPTPGQRDKLIRKALEFMQESAGRATSVEAVCAEIGIGIRSLQRAFRDRYDITPKRYLQAQRLNRVYHNLLFARPHTTTVAEAASIQGFWHMSQFASDYRRFFGELPSATLSRSPGC